MGTLRIKKSFLRQIKASDVMEELKLDNYFDKTHKEMMACVKDTLAYKQMREVAVKHMFNTLTNANRLPDAEAREEKKNQIARIGLLALQITSSISKTIEERLKEEATVTAKRALKRLSDKRSGCSDSLNNTRRKRKQNDLASDTLKLTSDKNKRKKDDDSESSVSLDGISVSSVHTSDLSSFDDEIVVSSEDEKGEKKEKRISFKTANKAYFDDGFSKIRNIIVRQKVLTGEASKGSKVKKAPTSESSEKSTESKISASRPKRERKPNSKYSDDM